MFFRQAKRIHILATVILTSLFWMCVLLFTDVYLSDLCHKEAIEKCPCLHEESEVSKKKLVANNQDRALWNKFPGGLQYEVEKGTNDPNLPGERGRAYFLPERDQSAAADEFKTHQFNIVVSDRIALNRSLQDVRMPQCRQKQYPAASTFPKTSIIIVFHNEAWSTLLRTLHSIINRTPLVALKEIIIVDDKSDSKFGYLQDELREEIKKFPIPIQLFRMPDRSGLIRARLKGAKESSGDILLFLDAHIECSVGWFEPLVARVMENPKIVISPIIDVIDDQSFEYVTASDMTWGGFNWKLNFRWFNAPPRENLRRHHDRTVPLRTPTMAGGLFAMSKAYFYELGAYDEGMDVWGAENLEMSFRVWMCGGELEIATCSHVGHVFRKTTPYTFPGGTATVINHNQRRVAEVWMDEYAKFFFAVNPQAKQVPLGDISERLALRKKLGCKSFRWYLENIYPEAPIPLDVTSLGVVKNAPSGLCLDTMGRKAGETVGGTLCHNQGGNQAWALTDNDELQNDEVCLTADTERQPVKLQKCTRTSESQKWRYDDNAKTIRHVKLGGCLTNAMDRWNPDHFWVTNCDKGNVNQQWTFSNE